MKVVKPVLVLGLFLFIGAQTLLAKTIKISSKKGSSVEKLQKAYKEAKS